MSPPPVSIIIPAHNEATVLARTAPALRSAIADCNAQVIYVLNATTDCSAAIISSVFAEAAQIVRVTEPGKTNALNAGDAVACHFPRFYLDADIEPETGIFEELAKPLLDGTADMAAAPLTSDLNRYPPLARAVARIWLSLPQARENPFQVLVGFSRAGRENWKDWPNVLADDDFARAHIAPGRAWVSSKLATRIELPRTLRSWVGVRARWLCGQRQLRRMSIVSRTPPTQANCLIKRLLTPANTASAVLFIAIRLVALPVSYVQEWSGRHWYRDDTTR